MMAWQDILRARITAAVGKLGLAPDRTATLIEEELKQAVAATEAGRALGAQPEQAAPEADDEPLFAVSEEDYAARRLEKLRARAVGKWV
jgi:hypothetical protein